MQLLVQAVGALAAGLLVWSLARGVGMRGRPAVATVVVVAIVAGALLGTPGIRNEIAVSAEQRHVNEALSAEQKRMAAGAVVSPNEGFLEWTAERIPEGERFQLVTEPSVEGQLQALWVSYRLEPRLEVVKAAPGGWLIFYEVPEASYTAPPGFKHLQVYEPGFAIARNEHGE